MQVKTNAEDELSPVAIATDETSESCCFTYKFRLEKEEAPVSWPVLSCFFVTL